MVLGELAREARAVVLHEGNPAAGLRVVVEIARQEVLARAGVPEDQDGAGVRDGRARQVALVQLGAQPRRLLGLADDLRRPVLLQPRDGLSMAPLAAQIEAEGMAEGDAYRPAGTEGPPASMRVGPAGAWK